MIRNEVYNTLYLRCINIRVKRVGYPFGLFLVRFQILYDFFYFQYSLFIDSPSRGFLWGKKSSKHDN